MVLRAPVEDRPPAVAHLDDALDRGPLAHVARVFGLSAFERRVLFLSSAVELDGDLAREVALLQGSTDPRPTFALAFALFADGHWDALAAASPLRHWHLVELGDDSTLASRPLHVEESVLHFMAGVPGTDVKLDGIVRHCQTPPLAPSHRRTAQEMGFELKPVGEAVATT